MKTPLISLIVTVYDLEKYIAACLDSILYQAFDDYEIVLVDNASSDRSVEICKAYVQRYPDKIRYYQVPKEIAVMGTAHFYGFKIASGEYVQYVDGDDRLQVGSLALIAERILALNPDIVMGRFECYLENGGTNINNFIDAAFEAEKINSVSYDQALDYLSQLPNFHGVFWRYVFKRSLFRKSYKEAGDLLFCPFYSTLYADGIMLLKLFLRANSISFLDRSIYLYTRRADGSGVGFMAPESLSRDSVITLLNALYFLISIKPKDGKRTYTIRKIEYIFQFYKSGLTYAGETQHHEIAQILEDNIELLEALKDCGVPELERFYACIKEYGCLAGAVFYTNSIKDRLFEQLAQKHAEDLYLIPGGHKTLCTLELLKEKGYRPLMIFDNDPQKTGQNYDGIPCGLPGVISTWEESKKKSAVFVLSAMDEKLAEILSAQLKGLGIRDGQIIVKG